MSYKFLPAKSFEELAKQIPPELLAVFLCSLKSGFWPDGSVITDQQRATCERTLECRGVRLSDVPDFWAEDVRANSYDRNGKQAYH